MNILIRDDYMAISDCTNVEKITIKDFFTEKDLSNAITKRGFDKTKIKKVCFVLNKKGVLILRSGYLQDLIYLLKKENIEATVKDNRTKFDFQKKEYSYDDIRKNLGDFKYVEHQVNAVKKMLKTNVGVIKQPTSAGKSSTMSCYLKISKLPTLIVVSGVSLANQIMKSLNDDGVDCGICTGKGKIHGECMVSTIGSVKKITDLDRYKCVIVDELHEAAAKQYQDFLSSVNYPIRFGFSATPEGNSPFRWMKIRQFFGNIIFETFAEELLVNKVITPPEIVFKKTNGVPTLDWQSALEKNIINNKERNKIISNLANTLEGSTLILYRIIEHGEELQKLIKNSILLHGEHSLEERDQAIKDFKEGKVKTIIASNIFKQGISINEINNLIVAGGGKSKIETLQKLGRVLRKAKGKDVAYVYDFHDEGNRFTEEHSLQRANLYKKAGYTNIIYED